VLSIVEIDKNMGLSVAFMDRLIGYWSLVVVGLVLYIRRVRSEMLAAEPSPRATGA